LYLRRKCIFLEKSSSIYRGGDRKAGRFKGEERLAVGRYSTLLSKEEHKVAASALFYYITRKVIRDN
jgi:hypothetical protein